MKNKKLYFGVMQGRLLSKYKNKYQAFPLTKWRSEFSKIKKYNLDCIELIFDEINNIKKNPLYNFKGLEEIKLIKKKRRVKIFSVCADYFIKNPLYLKSKRNLNILKRLIENCNYLGIKYIILPFVDKSSLNTYKKKQKALNNLKFILKDLKKNKLNLSLETDLKPVDFKNFMKKLNPIYYSINYDTGNSASLGYDINEEFNVYGNLIKTIHIKDRILNGGPIILGKGNFKIKIFFKILKKLRNLKFIIFQLYRDNDEITFKRQFNYFNKEFRRILS